MKYKLDVKRVNPVLSPKNKQVKDPPRYPNVINGYEMSMKRNYTTTLQKTIIDISKYMFDQNKI